MTELNQMLEDILWRRYKMLIRTTGACLSCNQVAAILGITPQRAGELMMDERFNFTLTTEDAQGPCYKTWEVDS